MNVVRAAAVGDVEKVKQWLSAPRHRHTEHAWQVLQRAASNGHDNICELVLNSGHVSDDDIARALSAACQFDQLSTAQLLVRHGHINTQLLTKALSGACLKGHMRIITWLISDVMTLSHTDRITWRLMAACACGDMSDIQQLATQVDSDVTRVMGQALRVACYRGKHDVVKWLMSHTTADASSRGVMYDTEDEVTSLMAACDWSRCGIVTQLLQCVTPHTVNMMSGKQHDTALNFIICSEVEASSLVVDAGIEGNTDTAVNLLDVSDIQVDNGFTALHLTCMYGHVDIVRMLLSNFACTDVTNDDRRTPAMLAELFGHTEVLPYLQCPMLATPDCLVPVSDNNTVSVSELPVEQTTKSNSTQLSTRLFNALQGMNRSTVSDMTGRIGGRLVAAIRKVLSRAFTI